MKRLLIFLSSLAGATLHAAQPQPQISFNRDVRPILSENCFACHGFDPKHRQADLRLDTFAGATEDHDGIRGIVPGDLTQSAAWQRIISTDPDEVMPPPKSHKPPLSPAQRTILKTWIEQGAKYERHWSFEPPKPSPGSSIDSFIQDRLAQEKLSPSPAASPATLIRRVSLDLTGLPPTPEEVAAFLADPSDQAYSKLVDRLLQSPHYGERWGRWWLDQARYADSNGYSIDAPRQIWKFRDWVIDALNADMPFDQFTIEQLAGDLLPNASESQKIATGFHRNTQINQEGGIDKEQFRIDSVFDRVATTGTVWLGLSIGCAQCHDHKFDPIEQKEYYQLFAFFNNQDEPTLKIFDQNLDVRELTREFKQLETQIKTFIQDHTSELDAWEAGLTPAIKKSLSSFLTKILALPKNKRSFAQNQSLFAASVGGVGTFRELNDRYKEIDTLLNQGVTTLVMKELPKPRKTTVFIKGDFTRPADEVTPGTPGVLHPFKSTPLQPNRLDLAKWIVSPENPLTARVIVNRIWQQYFGRGLVETENDFGMQGTTPSHPELLDWLATELLAKKWSLKDIHRLIVTSNTYRQSSSNRPDLREKDPGNYLLARQSRLRLDAEVVRDVALSASGLLAPQIGGPPVYPPIPDGVMGQGQVKRTWTVSKGADRYRRGLYTFIYRASPPPTLTVFDALEGFTTCTRRIRSNTPLQALTLMNDSGFFEFATALEKIIQSESLDAAFRRCTSRPPHPDELAILQKLDPLTAARTLLNLDETVTRE
ncbi:MAG: PSD1 and planctomycete cytochrome C domain-containing protein [Verrucomicrobiaceae bacterium]|nr:PSD1 and planctomycete cytochrome C domain-containing protein [Verrucomicrobiaceae bacterium]